jgi:superfamily II DNA or RNA helicase
MLIDCDWSLHRVYKTGSENEPIQFYLEGLANSKQFDLLLGFFSSSAINLLSVGFATFISKGGRVRMVINHLLSERDKEAIAKVEDNPNEIKLFDISDVSELRKQLDEYDTHFFECLAYLIATKRIEIKIIKPKDGMGIAHYKSGVFNDGTERVGYQASCNFTLYGLSENLEHLQCFLSWENGRSNKFIYTQTTDIDNYFAEKDQNVEYLSAKDIEVAVQDQFGNKDIDELLVQESKLLEKRASMTTNPRVKATLDKLLKDIEIRKHTPRFPFPSGPRQYQKDAYQNWVANNYQGIFAMATGTGKTLTALNCVLEEYKKTETYNVIILVPTKVLVEQWEKEVSAFNFSNIIKISSQNTKWQSELNALRVKSLFGGKVSSCIISTYASFTSSRFQDYLKGSPDQTILIADEAHNLGSPRVLAQLDDFKIFKRIGLSATPRRIYDVDGSAVMEKFFNDKEPYTYNFSMKRAVDDGILTKYYYYPYIVELNEGEMEEYAAITKQLVAAYNQSEKNEAAKKSYEMLLMKRKAIIHKSKNKLRSFENILISLKEQKDGLKNLLVYAPEGKYQDTDDLYGEFEDLDNENRIIDYYSNVIRKVSPDTTVTQYTSQSEDKEHILKSFSKGSIDVLLSMKCLDEGVDIPRTEKAIFCSSTGNPRQFIQRRGRILRRHPEKAFAYVYDLVVIPRVSIGSYGYELERNLVKKELERVVHFAYLAMNKYEAIETMREMCDYYDLNLDTLHKELM